MSDPMLLWVTRSAPFNLRTRRNLAELGHRSVTAPVLHIRPTGVIPPATEPTAIAVTSAHAFRCLAPQESWRALPLFTVGEHCAAIARDSGYQDVRPACGTVSDLRDLILGSVSRFGHVVHFGAREPAGDLVGDLARGGLSAELLVVYESIEATSEQLKALAMGLPFAEGIIVHSPKGARVAARIARQAGWSGIVFALSEACARPFERLPGVAVEIAPEPTEGSLMKLIGDFRPSPALSLRDGEQGDAPVGRPEGAPGPYLRLVVSNEERASRDDGSWFGSGDPPPTAA